MRYLVLLVRVSLDRLGTKLTAIITKCDNITLVFTFQINYLIDECFNTGKGANTIISMLHHFFEHHAFGETEVHLLVDNCTGQNKNHFMIYYLMWRVMTGLHKEITLSFLLVGHTKFAPDWCFGLLKQYIKRQEWGASMT